MPTTWAVGDTKPMEIGGSTYDIQIIGKNHDTYTDGGVAPLTFQIVECYKAAQMNAIATNSTGWPNSDMRTTTLPTILAAMPSEVQNAIKAVNKSTIEGCKDLSNSNPTTLETTSDRLFLLSETEVLGSSNNAGGVAEGSYYAYYANGGSYAKTLNGFDKTWWLRGPDFDTSRSFSGIGSGGYRNTCAADGSCGVAFGFCF